MSKIAIVTDSTASCSQSQIGNVPVYSVPLDVIWGEDTFQDGVTLFPDEFYEKLKTATVMPTTSQPSPQAFYDVYKKLLDEGYEVISIHISMGISGTLNSAIQAKKMLGSDAPVEILDSYVTAMVLKMVLIEAAEAIEAGKSLAEVVQVVKSVRDRCHVYFTVETLEFLERGGRMTRLQAFAGNLLQIRPILTFVDGKITSIEKARTFKGALKSLKQYCLDGMQGKKVRNVVATYTDNQQFVTGFYNDLLEEVGIERPAKAFIDPLTPVIGTHTGPGCIGLAFLLEE